MSLKTAVETSKAVDKVYSFTSWPAAPIINILVPSLLKAKPLTPPVSWATKLKPVPSPLKSLWVAVETSKAVDKVYSFTSLPAWPVTYILVPSLLKATSLTTVSWAETSKPVPSLLKSLKTAVETSNGDDKVYSFTSSPTVPNTNILVPSLLKVKPLWSVSWAERSKPVPSPLKSLKLTAAACAEVTKVRLKIRNIEKIFLIIFNMLYS